MSPADIVKQVTDSGLRGRGGAAFPTGIKWKTVLNTSLVYEYSGPDAPSLASRVEQYADWRSSLADMTRKHEIKP